MFQICRSFANPEIRWILRPLDRAPPGLQESEHLLLLVWVNTQLNLPLDIVECVSSVSAYCNELFRVNDAMELLRMSRTDFFRFRKNHLIRTLPGRRLHGADIVRVFERKRGLSAEGPFPPLIEYAKKLLKLDQAGCAFQMSETTLYLLRVRHKVPYLPGGMLHHDDIVAALEADRRAETNDNRASAVRVVSRRKAR